MIGIWSFPLLRVIILPLLLLLPLQPLKAQEIALGDSLACGIRDAGRLNGGCKIGASPHAVRQMVETYPYPKIGVVILSCGMSNNPAQFEDCEVDMQFLNEAGMKVIVLGVGDRLPDSSAINEALRTVSDAYGNIFVWGWQDVHPASYPEMLRVIREEECRAWRICNV